MNEKQLESQSFDENKRMNIFSVRNIAIFCIFLLISVAGLSYYFRDELLPSKLKDDTKTNETTELKPEPKKVTNIDPLEQLNELENMIKEKKLTGSLFLPLLSPRGNEEYSEMEQFYKDPMSLIKKAREFLENEKFEIDFEKLRKNLDVLKSEERTNDDFELEF